MGKRLILLLWIAVLAGCRPAGSPEAGPASSLPEQTLQDIESYLETNAASTAFGGKVFCAGHVLASEQQGDRTTAYLWALCQEYYRDGGTLATGTGSSFPVAVVLEPEGGRLRIVEHRVPRDGSFYDDDVRAIFPRSTWSQVVPETAQDTSAANQRVQALEAETRARAEAHYP